MQRLLAQDETPDASPPAMGGKRRPGPTRPASGLPASHWPSVVQRVAEQNEPLPTVAEAYGVSHETIRGLMLAVQKPRGQPEA